MDFDPICQQHARLTEIPRVFCLPKSSINESGGKLKAGATIGDGDRKSWDPRGAINERVNFQGRKCLRFRAVNE